MVDLRSSGVKSFLTEKLRSWANEQKPGLTMKRFLATS